MTDLPYSTLSDRRLLDLLRTEGDRLPRAAVDEIVARGDRMVEPLTKILIAEKDWYDEGPSFWRPIHATYILGAIGGEKALPGLIGALRCAADPDFEVDWVCDELPHIFAAIGPPAIRPLLMRAAEVEPESYERQVAFWSLTAIAERQPDRRTEILDALREVAGDENEPEEARMSAGGELLDFARPQDKDLLLALARLAEKSGEDALFKPRDVHEAYNAQPRRPIPPRDWLDFYAPAEAERRLKEWREDEAQMELEDPSDFAGEPFEEEDVLAGLDDPSGPNPSGPAKVGRNDPCPCGSGKKFKKCCEP